MLHHIDARGTKCLATTLAMTPAIFKLSPGDVLEVLADCETFDQEVRDWCLRTQKVLLRVWKDEGCFKAQIRF